ncbi:MAG: SpoIIE family protein phosphatase, partial [Actinobacteria bacterium]|nr:SpoIIE family protein phosphatase [Actinomycetota bacterium]NIS34509.1 SpoIIE family protein phosphatase [Actinomycetota bacterium]NIU69273.1 SpoIIE family protein phosphatase [Actinomycetota bacterium]NIV89259.1 SpoIIE family protein phosphatase [Actinomycetota bacterium]NIW31147.1 SpoIIE family protein phosphatase [Actinomycetota bacterium]
TDGVTEAMDPARTPYGDERLLALVAGTDGAGPKELVETIFADVDEHTGSADRFDDVTVLALEFRGDPSVERSTVEIALANRADEIRPMLDRLA